MTCDSKTTPIWFHNSHPIRLSRARFSANSMFISGITFEDGGLYSCGEINVHGYIYIVGTEARVVVIGKLFELIAKVKYQ